MPKYDAPVGRAVVHDDIFDKAALTLEDLVKGIKDSGTKMKIIYYDACLMGMLEIMSGITECADYGCKSCDSGNRWRLQLAYSPSEQLDKLRGSHEGVLCRNRITLECR